MLLLLVCTAAAAESAVVIRYSAGAEVRSAGAESPSAITVPYALGPTDALVLHDGASALVFVDGHVVNLAAAGAYTLGTFRTPVDGAAAPAGFLRRLEQARSNDGVVAAARGEGASLSPLPNFVTDRFVGVRWECTGAPQPLSLFNASGALVWSAIGCGAVAYRGPALPPGEYRLTIDGVATGFAVGGVEMRHEVARLLRGAHPYERGLTHAERGLTHAERDVADGMWLCAAGWPGAAASRIGRVDGLQAAELLLALPTACAVGGAP